MEKQPQLILASASPRRRELLAAAGFSFEVSPTSVDERKKRGESARAMVVRLAKEKATAAFLRLGKRRLPILGVDTVVVIGDKILGKPASPADAKKMLRLLSGKQHRVMSGICLLIPPRNSTWDSKRPRKIPRNPIAGRWKCDARVATTIVKFRKLTAAEIDEYVAGGEPMDKAGAYAIQGGASKYTEWIRGCYFNVVGLPVSLFDQMLGKAQLRRS